MAVALSNTIPRCITVSLVLVALHALTGGCIGLMPAHSAVTRTLVPTLLAAGPTIIPNSSTGDAFTAFSMPHIALCCDLCASWTDSMIGESPSSVRGNMPPRNGFCSSF